MSEPRYSAQEMRAKKKEVERLRDRAVRSWTKDRVGNCSLVIMTFGDYMKLAYRTRDGDD